MRLAALICPQIYLLSYLIILKENMFWMRDINSFPTHNNLIFLPILILSAQFVQREYLILRFRLYWR